jgi:hypothetical protein
MGFGNPATNWDPDDPYRRKRSERRLISSTSRGNGEKPLTGWEIIFVDDNDSPDVKAAVLPDKHD